MIISLQRIGHAQRGRKPEFKLERFPLSYAPACGHIQVHSLV
jgi:hypothetical protein